MTPDLTALTNQPILPLVSVIIPIYNGEADLPDLLDCLYAQTYPIDRVEYLLVDNNSSDRTFEMLQAAVEPARRTESIRLYPLQELQIQSSYAARNAGIRVAHGEILAFTDADCRPDPQWLSCLVQPFANSEVGIAAGEVKALPGHTLLERYADRRETLSQKHTLAHPFYPYGQTANLAVRRQALEQVGLFRPYLTTGGDADLCWRIQQQSHWTIQFAETAIVQHRHRATLVELRSQWRRYGRSNRYLHELHGVALGRELSLRDYFYRGSRWLLKEIPLSFKKINISKNYYSDFVEALVETPLELMCGQSRAWGQRQAKLPDAAREILPFEQRISELLVDVSDCEKM